MTAGLLITRAVNELAVLAIIFAASIGVLHVDFSLVPDGRYVLEVEGLRDWERHQGGQYVRRANLLFVLAQ